MVVSAADIIGCVKSHALEPVQIRTIFGIVHLATQRSMGRGVSQISWLPAIKRCSINLLPSVSHFGSRPMDLAIDNLTSIANASNA